MADQSGKEAVVSLDRAGLEQGIGELESLVCGLRHEREALQEKEQVWRTILESAPDIIFTIDSEHRIKYINRTVPGFTIGAVIGTSFYDYISPEHRAVCRGAVEHVFQTGEATSYETIADGPHGSRVWYASRVGPILRGGKVTAVTHVCTDITLRKRTEAELWRAKEQAEVVNQELRRSIEHANRLTAAAERASAAKSEFLASMSHEVRNPVNRIMNMVSVLQGTALSEAQKKYTEMIKDSADSLLGLVNDVLDLSAIEAGKLNIDSVDFDLLATLKGIFDVMAIEARCKGLDFFCSLDPAVPPMVRGDPGRLRQVLHNLADNAIKFTPSGSVAIRVGVDRCSGQRAVLRFTVIDTGAGIAREKLDGIFERYNRADVSRNREIAGTGLGLAISRKLVEGMGGQIGVESQPGKGSLFWFTVDLECRASEREVSCRHGSGDGGGQSARPRAEPDRGEDEARILFVEDNENNRKVSLMLLQSFGYTVEGAASGREAVSAMRSRRYALVLMDVEMPDMDGLAATRVVRDPSADVLDHCVPIIAMTAHAMNGDRERCLQAGMNDYISKPVQVEELLSTIDKWMPSERIERTPVQAFEPLSQGRTGT